MIEEAVDGLKDLNPSIKRNQRRELEFSGVASKLGAANSPDFMAGYELGLQVARVALAQEPKAAENDINI